MILIVLNFALKAATTWYVSQVMTRNALLEHGYDQPISRGPGITIMLAYWLMALTALNIVRLIPVDSLTRIILTGACIIGAGYLYAKIQPMLGKLVPMDSPDVIAARSLDSTVVTFIIFIMYMVTTGVDIITLALATAPECMQYPCF